MLHDIALYKFNIHVHIHIHIARLNNARPSSKGGYRETWLNVRVRICSLKVFLLQAYHINPILSACNYILRHLRVLFYRSSVL